MLIVGIRIIFHWGRIYYIGVFVKREGTNSAFGLVRIFITKLKHFILNISLKKLNYNYNSGPTPISA